MNPASFESITVNNSTDVRIAWQAIESQDPTLLPSPELGDPVTRVPELHSSERSTSSDFVKLISVDLPQIDVYSHRSLAVSGPAIDALKTGLTDFSKGPERSDYTHLRLGKILVGIRKQRVARRILETLK